MNVNPLNRAQQIVGDTLSAAASVIGNMGGDRLFGAWVKLRWEPGSWWYCDHAAPVVWFTTTWLELARTNKSQANHQWQKALECGQIGPDEPEWSFFGPWHVEGDRIKLKTTNGTWIWVLTGRVRWDLDDSGRVTHWEAKWPD